MYPVFALQIMQEKYQKKKKKCAHDIRISRKSIRQSSQRFDMVGHEKEIDPRRVCETETGHPQKH